MTNCCRAGYALTAKQWRCLPLARNACSDNKDYYQGIYEEWDSGDFSKMPIQLTPPNEFLGPIFRANTAKIGLLGDEVSGRVVFFYENFFTITLNLDLLSESKFGKTTMSADVPPESRLLLLKKTLKRWDELESGGISLIDDL